VGYHISTIAPFLSGAAEHVFVTPFEVVGYHISHSFADGKVEDTFSRPFSGFYLSYLALFMFLLREDTLWASLPHPAARSLVTFHHLGL
jgi:hypothetical protein